MFYQEQCSTLFFKFGGLYAVLNDSLTYINRHYELDLGLHCANVQSFAGCEMRIERNISIPHFLQRQDLSKWFVSSFCGKIL